MSVQISDIERRLLTARTEDEVRRLMEDVERAGVMRSRPIGSREANAGTIELATNPYSALSERVTNGIDAVIELHAQRAGYVEIEDWPTPPRDPREAAELLLGLPKAGIGDLTDKERRALAENLVVILEESGGRQHPTAIIEDKGVGQSAGEMPEGLLSLNSSNKVRKPWQHGAYGQGGSATLRFCPYTIFVSRKAPDLLGEEEVDAVAWTIAFRDEGDPYKEALPVYRYLVDESDVIPTFDIAELPDPTWHGTRVVHIGYDLTRYSQAFTQLTNGIWGMFHAQLFDPILPFLIGGRRQVDLDSVKKGASVSSPMNPLAVSDGDSTRVVLGNRLRLETGPHGRDLEIPWRGSEVRDLSKLYSEDLGRLRVNYWVVRRPRESTKISDPTEGYVTADSAVTVTLNGQRHDAERRGWLKTKLKLPYLSKALIVQIDIDELSPPARRKLFSSSRESTVEGPMKDLIYQEAIEALKADDELRRLEAEMRERAMSKGAREVGEKVRSKLERFVNTFLRGKTKKIRVDDQMETIIAPPPNALGKPSPPRSTDDDHLPNFPSDMEFGRDPIVITQGKRTTVWVHLDAKNEYLERHQDQLTIGFSPELGGKVLHVGTSTLLAGKSMWTLFAEDDAPIGEGEIEANLITPTGVITASAKVKVVAPPVRRVRKQREEDVPLKGPKIVWVYRNDWDANFNEATVGEVNLSDDSTDIRINHDHPILEKVLKDKRLNEEQVRTREDRYLFAMACGLFLQEYSAQKLPTRLEDDVLRAEQERMAEAVLIAIDEKLIDFDE